MKAIVEKGDDGLFSVYTKEVNGVFGSGMNLDEAKADFVRVLNEQAEYYKSKSSVYPQWYSAGKYKFEWIFVK